MLRKYQIETTMAYLLEISLDISVDICIRRLISKKLSMPTLGQGVERSLREGMQNGAVTLEESLAVSYKIE